MPDLFVSIEKNIEKFLIEQNITEITHREIAEKVISHTVEWRKSLSDGRSLLLLRLSLPVVEREEVFLGNVLLNKFLITSLENSMKRSGLLFSLIFGDIRDFYYLIIQPYPLDEIIKYWEEEIGRLLPELYFSDTDPVKGIFGDFSNMFSFRKSDFEPFPIYAVPSFLRANLERAIRTKIQHMLASSEWEESLQTIVSSIAFFYGKTSGGSGDCQSPATFLIHLASEYGIVQPQELIEAFNLDISADIHVKAVKDQIKKSFSIKRDKQKRTREILFNPTHLKKLLIRLLDKFEKGSTETNEWLLPYVANKLIQESEKEFIRVLIQDCQIGHYGLRYSKKMDTSLSCRLCGCRNSILLDKNILVGLAIKRFHNQVVRQKGIDKEKLCIKCGVSSYLITKLLGSYTPKREQIPKTYNLIFHYGKHTDDELQSLNRKLDRLFTLVREFRNVDEIRNALRDREKFSIQIKGGAEKDALDALLEVLDSPSFQFAPALEAIAGIVDTDSPLKSKIIPIGMGELRLILFILPQFRLQGEELRRFGTDFIQKRFSKSRIYVYAILGLLREICGCEGSYYYQSIPLLTLDQNLSDTFYIRSYFVSASKAIAQYNVISKYVQKLIAGRVGKSITDKILLAERFLDEPLETFSEILRNSPIRGGDRFEDFKYKRLSNEWIKGQGVVDSLEYLKMFKELSQLEEVS